MKIWTPEEEADKLKARFEGVNRAAFAREQAIKGGQVVIYQHIKGVRPISRAAALAYAKGFNVSLSEISPRLAIEAANAVAQGNKTENNHPEIDIETIKSAVLPKEIEDVIALMLETDEIGKGRILLSAKEIVQVRKATLDSLPKPIVSTRAKNVEQDILDNGDWGLSENTPSLDNPGRNHKSEKRG